MNAITSPKQAHSEAGNAETALISKLQLHLAEKDASLQRMTEEVQSLLQDRARLQAQLASARRDLTVWKGIAALGTMLGLTIGRKVR